MGKTPDVPVTITWPTGKSFSIDEKRVNLPFFVEWTCPKCGAKRHDDYSGQFYLSFPSFNEKSTASFCCYECDFEGKFTFILKFDMEILQNE